MPTSSIANIAARIHANPGQSDKLNQVIRYGRKNNAVPSAVKNSHLSRPNQVANRMQNVAASPKKIASHICQVRSEQPPSKSTSDDNISSVDLLKDILTNQKALLDAAKNSLRKWHVQDKICFRSAFDLKAVDDTTLNTNRLSVYKKICSLLEENQSLTKKLLSNKQNKQILDEVSLKFYELTLSFDEVDQFCDFVLKLTSFKNALTEQRQTLLEAKKEFEKIGKKDWAYRNINELLERNAQYTANLNNPNLSIDETLIKWIDAGVPRIIISGG